MLISKHKYNLWFRAIAIGIVCLFAFNSISWSLPKSTLSVQSRLKPFFKKHGLDFQSIFTMACAAGELKKLITSDSLRKSHIPKLNTNSEMQNAGIEIETEIKQGEIECTGKKYKYAVFHFKKANKTINVLFLEDHANLAPSELEELRINDAEKHHLDCLGLEGVWFINPDTQPPAAVPDTVPTHVRPISIPESLAMVDVTGLPRYLRIDLLEQDEEEFRAIAEEGILPQEARDIMDHPETTQWSDTFNPKIACYLNAFFRGSWEKGESRLQQFKGISKANFYDTVYGSLGNLYTWAAWQRAGLDPNVGIGKRLAAIYPSAHAAYARGPGNADGKEFIDHRDHIDSFVELLKTDAELLSAVLSLITSYHEISMEDHWYRTNFDYLLSGMGDQNEAGDTPYGILFSNPVLDKLVKAGVITKSHFDKLDQERLKSYFYNVLWDILPYQLRAKYSDQSKVPYQKAKEIADKAFDHIEAINSYVESENKTMQWYVGQVHAILSAAKSQGILIADDIWAEFRQRVMECNGVQGSITTPLSATGAAQDDGEETNDADSLADSVPAPAITSTTSSAKNKYYLISGSTGGVGSTLAPLYDKLPQPIKDKVVTHVVSSTFTARAQYNVPPELEQHILDYFREHIQKAKDADAVPILIGGLHVLSYWFYIALGEVYGIEADIVSLDMDTDMMTYNLDDCGFWAYGMKKGTIDPKKMTVVGMGPIASAPVKWAIEQGATLSEHDLPEARRYENVFVSLDTDVYMEPNPRLKPERLQEIVTRLSSGNILGLHISNLEANYIFGLRDSELNFMQWLFPGIMLESAPVVTQALQALRESEYENLGRVVNHALLAKALRTVPELEIAEGNNKKSAFIFSERSAFGELLKSGKYRPGLGIFLRKLAKYNIDVAVVASTPEQIELIEELNRGKDVEQRIVIADSVAHARVSMPGHAKYYFFYVDGDNTNVDGVIKNNITDVVELIIKALGQACGIYSEVLHEKMNQAGRLFAEAA